MAAVEGGNQATKPAVGGIPPGLSENAHKKLLGENSYSPEEIGKVSMRLLQIHMYEKNHARCSDIDVWVICHRVLLD